MKRDNEIKQENEIIQNDIKRKKNLKLILSLNHSPSLFVHAFGSACPEDHICNESNTI